jgi:hypothetical protein
MTGAELRAVPTPAVAGDRDLWLDVPDGRDRKIQDDDVVMPRSPLLRATGSEFPLRWQTDWATTGELTRGHHRHAPKRMFVHAYPFGVSGRPVASRWRSVRLLHRS